MITFGYKNRFGGFLRAFVAIAVGIVMVVSRTDAMVLAVRVIAAFLLASGKQKHAGKHPVTGIALSWVKLENKDS